MRTDKHNRPSSLISGILTDKCPHCRRGEMFLHRNPYDLKNMMKMPANCPVCGQPFEIEVGFYYGTGFVSYALAVIVCVASFTAWILLIGMSLNDNRLFWWIGTNALLLLGLQPILMRMSRTIWLYFFVRYDPNWKEHQPRNPERTNPDLKNDW
jgi:uncharacterized protein (DUF983 family)